LPFKGSHPIHAFLLWSICAIATAALPVYADHSDSSEAGLFGRHQVSMIISKAESQLRVNISPLFGNSLYSPDQTFRIKGQLMARPDLDRKVLVSLSSNRIYLKNIQSNHHLGVDMSGYVGNTPISSQLRLVHFQNGIAPIDLNGNISYSDAGAIIPAGQYRGEVQINVILF